MAKCATRETNFLGLDLLYNFFKSSYYDNEGKLVLANDFSDYPSYFLQKSCAYAISLVTSDREGHTPSDVLEFLIDLLKNNDNSENKYSDYSYIKSLLLAIGNTNTQGMTDTEKTLKELNRYLHFEELIPSYHNAITSACLQVFSELQAKRKIPINLDFFKTYTRYGYYKKSRLSALTAMIRLGLHDSETMDYLLNILESDNEPEIRRKLADILVDPPTAPYIKPPKLLFSSPNVKTLSFADRLFRILNSSATAYDPKTRLSIRRAIRSIWGTKPIGSSVGDNYMHQLESVAGRIDVNYVKRHAENRRRNRENKKSYKRKITLGNGDVGQGDFVASLVGGKLKIARTSIEDKRKKKIPKKEDLGSVKRLKIKIGNMKVEKQELS